MCMCVRDRGQHPRFSSVALDPNFLSHGLSLDPELSNVSGTGTTGDTAKSGLKQRQSMGSGDQSLVFMLAQKALCLLNYLPRAIYLYDIFSTGWERMMEKGWRWVQ